MNILITGHSSGIGKTLCNYFSKDNKIYGISRSKKIDQIPVSRQFNVDISDYESLKKVFTEINKLDVVINNASISIQKNIYDISSFNKTLDINLKGTYYCSILSVKKLQKSKFPSIINIASIAGYQALPNNPSYNVSKSGIHSLTRSLAYDLNKHSIRVNSVSPGFVKTEMTYKSFMNAKKRREREKRTILDKWAEPKDIIGITEYLMSKKSKYVTGQDFIIDGGWLARGL